MKKKNLILRYFGLGFLIIGLALSLKMYFNQEWPTYLFFLISFIGIVQVALSYYLKKIKVGWQILWALIPFVLMFIYYKI